MYLSNKQVLGILIIIILLFVFIFIYKTHNKLKDLVSNGIMSKIRTILGGHSKNNYSLVSVKPDKVMTYSFNKEVPDIYKDKVKEIIDNSKLKSRLNYVSDVGNADIEVFFDTNANIVRTFTEKAYYPDGSVVKFSYTSYGLDKTRIYFNLDNWNDTEGTIQKYVMPIDDYRIYVVLHEFGHALGYDHYDPYIKTTDNKVPIMYQYTRGKLQDRPFSTEWNMI